MKKTKYICDRCGETVFDDEGNPAEAGVPAVFFDSYSIGPYGALFVERGFSMDLCHACNVELLDFLRFKVSASAKRQLEVDHGVRPKFGDEEQMW